MRMKFILMIVFILCYVFKLSAQTNWLLDIDIQTNDAHSVLSIGGAASATDGFDIEVDVLSPPPPPSGSYTYFEIDDPDFGALIRDVRYWVSPFSTSITWILQITNASGLESSIFWNPADLPPLGDFHFIAVDSIDMRSVDSTGCMNDQTVTIEYHPAEGAIQTISLTPNKLNLISFNVQSDNTGISDMLDDIETLLVAQDDGGNFLIPPYGVNLIGDVDFSNGYQVYYTATGSEEIINEGTPLIPESITQNLTNTKLYMICNPYQTSQDVTAVFASIASNIVVVQDDVGQFWIPAYGVNTLGDMQPGKGYQIFVDTNVDFTYPALAGGGSFEKKIQPLIESLKPEHFSYHETGQAYGVVITGSEESLFRGDEIGVFAGDLCVGAGVFTGEYPLVIAAWQGNEEYELPGFTEGKNIILRLWKSSEEQAVECEFENNQATIFGKEPFSVLKLGTVEVKQALPIRFSLEQNYPNPFNPETRIKYQIPDAGQVRLFIYNMRGQEIKRLVDEVKEAGYYEVVWDGCDIHGQPLGSGVYIFRIKAGSFSHTRKILKVK